MRTLFTKDERRALAEKAADKDGYRGVSRSAFVLGHRLAMFWVDVFLTRKHGLPEDE